MAVIRKQAQTECDNVYNTFAADLAERQSAATAQYETIISKQNAEIDALTKQLDAIKGDIEIYNQSILQRRKIEENQTFYSVNLNSNQKNDIMILSNIRKELFDYNTLDKLIYDNYVSKSVNEMVKRVLAGREPCGIYKITRLKTGEIYIGKSTNIKDRWIQHCKSAFGVGTIANSMLHQKMAEDGVDQFTFEVVEETNKDALSVREKYWTDFYDSKKYGLNERIG